MNTEIAVAITREECVEQLFSESKKPTLADCIRVFNWQGFPKHLFASEQHLTHIYFGGEFCDRLLPDKKIMARVIALVHGKGLQLSLLTPLLSDHALARLKQVFSILPDHVEVIVNDWGTLNLLKRDFPKLVPVIGRQLCKMIKDPRLPSEQWTQLYPHGVQSGPFHQLLARFDIQRLEMDVPPFVKLRDFASDEKAVSVHLPYGFSVKGRMCKIGAMSIDTHRKFGPGHGCNKECLTYSSKVQRNCSSQAENQATQQGQTVNVQTAQPDLKTFQQGNTMFYRHTSQMTEIVAQAVALNKVNRMIFEGDWHEDYRAD
tara:strand:- start:21779 stop:22729 length:951 start_codon:yes stop_codon:yes gene_type:complete